MVAWALITSIAVAGWFLASPLAFTPVPWPVDASSSPALWLILNSLDFLGMDRIFGLTFAARATGFAGVIACAWIAWRWIQGRGASGIAAMLALALLLDPALRWGAFALRPELGAGLAWLCILSCLEAAAHEPQPKPRVYWCLAGSLGIAAYFHLPSALLIFLATLIGLWPWGGEPGKAFATWAHRAVHVAARAIALALPLVLFRGSVSGQFAMSNPNSLIGSAAGLLDGTLPSQGNAEPWPAILVGAKILFWVIAFFATNRATFLVLARAFKATGAHDPERSRPAGPMLAAGFVFWASASFWISRPHSGFTVLSHVALWGWAAAWAALELRSEPARSRTWLTWFAAAFAAVALAGAVDHQKKIPATWSWSSYHHWVECLGRSIQLGASAPGGASKRIWQPHYPDAVFELSSDGGLDLRRDLDSWGPGAVPDVIVLTTHDRVAPAHGAAPTYEGPERARDREWIRDGVKVPFGPEVTERFLGDGAKSWRTQICQAGPFWAALALRIGR